MFFNFMKSKSSTKKTTTKKAATKKVSKRTSRSSKKPLVVSGGEFAFWSNDGRVLSSLLDLYNALDEMSEDTYSYHVNPEKNDFSIWVAEVLCDKSCARDLSKAKTRNSARTSIKKHLSGYSI
ncbi:hypothetical protein KC842_02795 [Candidatus Nomurabacteria bacterium]|nr:hypothetical protein [Candidatus Nomurabacteria bacterium]